MSTGNVDNWSLIEGRFFIAKKQQQTTTKKIEHDGLKEQQ